MKKYVLGVDVGATHTKLAVLNLHYRILARTSFFTQDYKKDKLIEAISLALDSLIRKIGIKKKNILGLGIGVPGLVDFKKGLVFYFVNIPGWERVPLKKELERMTGFTVFVDNDVKIMALGELIYGAGKSYNNIICLTLGTGVGGAIIINGRLYRGSDLVAGEIGHIPINEKGPRCNCGNFGCLEAYVGREYFLDGVRKSLKKTKRSIIAKMVKNKFSDITPELLEKAALRGDTFAKKVWVEMGGHIGSALVGVVNFLNPELIIIGGGIAEAGKPLFASIRDTINKRAMRVQKKNVKVVKAKLGNAAALIGAAELVKRNIS